MNGRSFAAAALVVAASLLSFAAARGVRKPFSVEAPDYRRLGPADAKISIVEFSDFECPACKYAEPPLRGLLKLFEGRVRLTFKHYPLRFHLAARPGAVAAECAGRQGRFWDYHHLLYDRQERWAHERTSELLAAYARELNLDGEAFAACRKDPSAEAAVSADARDGEHAFVGSTPTFFVNGRRFVGGHDLAQRGIPFIEKELKK